MDWEREEKEETRRSATLPSAPRVLGRGLATPLLCSLNVMCTIIFWLRISEKLNKSGENSWKIQLFVPFHKWSIKCDILSWDVSFFFDSPLGCNWPLHNSTRERMSTDRHLAAVCTRRFFYKNYKKNFIHNQNSANKETRFAINNTGFNVLLLIKKTKIPRCHWASCFCRLINYNKKNC